MFKNAITYLVTPVFCLNPEILARFPARPCAPHESRTMGFTAPCNHSTDKLAHHVSGYTLICLETEDRLLPCSVVAEEVEQRAIDLEKLQGYKPGRKQMRELKRTATTTRQPISIACLRLSITSTTRPARIIQQQPRSGFPRGFPRHMWTGAEQSRKSPIETTKEGSQHETRTFL